MNYDFTINQHNIRPHVDIEKDIELKQNGLFTFNLRVNQGNIEDYAQFRTITISEYTSLSPVKKEPDVSHDTGVGSEVNAIRPDKR
jgi:hypothetical protein